MKSYLYKIECLTNLHVGSGDINFSIVDNEVEKDPTTGYPIINASGVKGAIRDYCSVNKDFDLSLDKVFGGKGDNDNMNAGDFKFFDARFLYRPMRTTGPIPSISVTTEKAINDFLDVTAAFGCRPEDLKEEENVKYNFPEKTNFITNSEKSISVEGVKTEKVNDLKDILGLGEFAVAGSFDNYDLPVIARNSLDDKGKSKNLWYEEYVPHGSAFYLIVLTSDEYTNNQMQMVIPNGSIIQFGGNASIGNGFCKMNLIGEGEC